MGVSAALDDFRELELDLLRAVYWTLWRVSRGCEPGMWG